MRSAVLLCGLLVAALGASAVTIDDQHCPPGLVGPTCATCETDAACDSLSTPDNPVTWCYTNHTYWEGTVAKTYACTTEGTDFQDSISNVWAQCNTQLQKCDVHFSLNGYGLYCSGLQCTFDGNSAFCGYTKCRCDGPCPLIKGVSLGYILDRLTGKTALNCEEGWPAPLCTIDIEGLQATPGGFHAYCQAGECRP